MTTDEWEGICTLLEAGWPGEFTDVERAAYRTLLDDRPAAELVAALKALARQGVRFRPSVSELAGAVHADPSLPTWPEVFRDVRRALFARQDYFAKGAAKEAVCVAWLDENSHPTVAAFFRAQTYERLALLPIDDPDDDGKWCRKRLQEDWERFVERAGERQAHGLPLDSGPARRQIEGPRKPDFAGALPAGPAHVQPEGARP